MKQRLEVYPFTFNKIASGSRKVDARVYEPNLSGIQVGDIIEYVNIETQNMVQRVVQGVALFTDFDTLLKYLSPLDFGYADYNEIKVRVERLYPESKQKKFGVCVFFICEVENFSRSKFNYMER